MGSEKQNSILTRRDFIKVCGLGIVALYNIINNKQNPINNLEIDPLSDNIYWTNALLNKLNENYYKKNESQIWFQNTHSNRTVPVLVNISNHDAIFQDGHDMEGGKETVHYVDKKHLYVLENQNLVAVSDYDHRIFTFEELSGVWREKLGDETIAEYSINPDNTTEIFVWRKNNLNNTTVGIEKVDSGYTIDLSGNLIQKGCGNLFSKKK